MKYDFQVGDRVRIREDIPHRGYSVRKCYIFKLSPRLARSAVHAGTWLLLLYMCRRAFQWLKSFTI